MNQSECLISIQNYVKDLFNQDGTGHDFFHMQRVARMAKHICYDEKADEFLCEAAAWLHDVGDYKLFKYPHDAKKNMNQFLRSLSISDENIKLINDIIEDVSFSKGKIPITLEGKIVQDADRLDAIGAIGIARTFAYGGSNGQLIYNDESTNTSVQHFYDKLLKLKDMMNTEKASKIAEQRHQFMLNYLDQFMQEWNEI